MAKNNSINNASGNLTIDPGASGDSYVQFDINTTGEFRIGVDDDTDDSFRISQGSTLGANDTFVMTSAGERTMPLQPAVLSESGNADNVTGDGTVYTLTTSNELFDQNNDYSSPNFTAPVTGCYLFNFIINHYLSLGTGGTQFRYNIVTSNRTYYGSTFPSRARVAGFFGVNSYVCWSFQVLADMDSGDTAYFALAASGGPKNDDFRGSNFNCTLIC